MAQKIHLFTATVLFLAACAVAQTPLDPNIGKTCQISAQQANCNMLVCVNNKCSTCTLDSQCELTYSKFRCIDNACVHKTLFPMDVSDILSTILMFIIIAAASGGGGIGGGGALVPLYVLVAGFKAGSAIPLSKATIFGGAVANLIINVRKRHPLADRPLIDYRLATLFVPMQLLGTMVGVLCNKTFPNWLLVLCLIIFLTWLTKVTFGKGLIIYRNETGRMDALRVSLTASAPLASQVDSAAKSPEEVAEERRRHLMSVGGERLQAILKDERGIPFSKIGLLLIVWIVVVGDALVKGGEGASIAGVACNSPLYWVLFIVPFPLITTMALLIGRQARKQHEERLALGYHFYEGDVQWDARNTVIYPLINIGVGFGSGALGIGGGTMTGPLMLHLQMNTQVVTATASFMILFTSSITSAQFIIFGVLEPSYGAWFAFFGFLASFVGQTVMAYILRKYKRQSIVVFCIACILGVSAILLGFQGIRRTIIDIEHHVPMGFRPLCSLSA